MQILTVDMYILYADISGLTTRNNIAVNIVLIIYAP